jgi:protein tyrosine/serine phosphatase
VEANFRAVLEGRVYRSGQPSPSHLRAWKEKYGLRTVINLRGTGTSDYAEERRTAQELGLGLVDLEWSAKRIPGPQAVDSLVQALESAEQPLLVHCAEGVDRSGVASALTAMVVGGQNYDDARRQLSRKYLNAPAGESGVVGLMQKYEAWCLRERRGTGGWREFREWLQKVYRE